MRNNTFIKEAEIFGGLYFNVSLPFGFFCSLSEKERSSVVIVFCNLSGRAFVFIINLILIIFFLL